jgi:hypothetical protein
MLRLNQSVNYRLLLKLKSNGLAQQQMAAAQSLQARSPGFGHLGIYWPGCLMS